MNPRLLLAVIAALLLAVSCRVHVTIWLAGHPVARPPAAGFALAAIALACAVLLAMIWRQCRGFRSTPYPRAVPA